MEKDSKPMTTSTHYVSNVYLIETNETSRIAINIDAKSMMEFQNCIRQFGGIFNIYKHDATEFGEAMYWATLCFTRDNIIVTVRSSTMEKQQYDLIRASLKGNTDIFFMKPTNVTLIDGLYFVLPNDASTYWETPKN